MLRRVKLGFGSCFFYLGRVEHFLQTRPGRSTSFIADLSILHTVNAPTAAYRIDRQAPGELNTLTVSLIWVVVL